MSSAARSLFAAIPRVVLGALPTPLTEARGLREALGGPRRCPRIVLKRDDLTGLALGGNKVRKLEYLIADARRCRATSVIRLLAEGDGVLLDPTYTAKAMAALIADIRAGSVAPDDTVVFLHTGGAPALFAHAGLFD